MACIGNGLLIGKQNGGWLRAGMGYKLSHQWQFEIIYMWQESKNTLADDYENQQSIIRLRVKQTLNNKKLNQ